MVLEHHVPHTTCPQGTLRRVDVKPAVAPGGDRWLLNRTQYVPGQRAGHYESFYQRANHTERPLAFWIRYTIFAPDGRPEDAIGELWAVYFDGESGRHVVAKEEHPIADCEFGRDEFAVRVKDAVLGPEGLSGAARASAGAIAWDLRLEATDEPVLLLPPRLYGGRVPKAKSLVAAPNAGYSGVLTVNGTAVAVDGWVGSQNHNWGSRHTDEYAFGQVAGFDGEPDAFLEVVTAKAAIAGPISTPYLTFATLRLRGQEHALTSVRRAVRAKGRFGYFHWVFSTGDDRVRITGRIGADRDAFVGLSYHNPPGGAKHCLNTKIATAELAVADRTTGRTEMLRTRHRALFEICTDDRGHGVPIRA
jgi:hypothetical protein